MVLINNKKTYKSKNLIGKGKYIIGVVDQSLVKQVGRVKDKGRKLKLQ